MDDILDLSKLEAGKVELESVPFDLREMMEDLVTEAAVRGREKGLDTVFSVDPSIPSILRGDPLRTRQILGNLLGNAVKFTLWGCKAGRLSRGAGTQDRARFAVSDTGIGVSENTCTSFSLLPRDPSTTRGSWDGARPFHLQGAREPWEDLWE